MSSFSPEAAGLNPAQVRAVKHLDGPLLVLAGAGSGKTRVITQKIAYLLGDCGYRPENVAAVTFTNKAAREMKARITALLGKEKGRGLTVSTFHTLGLRIIQSEHKAVGLKRGFTIFDASDARTLVAELLKADAQDLGQVIDKIQWQISDWKSGHVAPETALSHAEDKEAEYAARVYIAYQRSLRAYNAVDFDDLISLPVTLFETEPEVLAKWRGKLRYLLVDEYQDTNASQYALLKLLAGPRAMFTVVGDDDQSIYAWRGARPENLVDLKTDFPNLEVVKLEQNYRSTGRILRSANELIARNPHIFDKQLWSALGEGLPIRVMACPDAFEEAERVVTQIINHKLMHNSAWHDYAILYRGNHQAKLFEKMLREHKVPYLLSGGTSFFDRSEVRDIIAYLRLILNPDNDAAFLRIVNVPRRELGATTLEKLGAYATERHTSLFNAAGEIGFAQMIQQRTQVRFAEFQRMIVELGDEMSEMAPAALVKELLERIHYEDWLRETCTNDKQAESCWENVQDLVSWMENLAKRADGDYTLSEGLAHMSLMDMLDRTADDEAEDQVSLMTLHAAKGLEFPHVFMVGVEEELLPHRNSIEAETIEEERRLMYVGITRAQRTLTLSMAEKRRRYGEDLTCEPSRFVAELPADDLEWLGRQQDSSPEQRMATGKAHLAGLKGLLAEN